MIEDRMYLNKDLQFHRRRKDVIVYDNPFKLALDFKEQLKENFGYMGSGSRYLTNANMDHVPIQIDMLKHMVSGLRHLVSDASGTGFSKTDELSILYVEGNIKNIEFIPKSLDTTTRPFTLEMDSNSTNMAIVVPKRLMQKYTTEWNKKEITKGDCIFVLFCDNPLQSDNIDIIRLQKSPVDATVSLIYDKEVETLQQSVINHIQNIKTKVGLIQVQQILTRHGK